LIKIKVGDQKYPRDFGEKKGFAKTLGYAAYRGGPTAEVT
jgi:hypothetical protein